MYEEIFTNIKKNCYDFMGEKKEFQWYLIKRIQINLCKT